MTFRDAQFDDEKDKQRTEEAIGDLQAHHRPTPWRPLPAQPLSPCRELRVSMSRFSTLVVQGNTSSVPSRLVGTTLLVRIRAEHLEGYLGSKQVVMLPRLHGRGQHAINYHHIIWSLVRKPGAFAAYRYRDDLSPTLAFRRAYDRLMRATPARADREYVRLLHLAATLSETDVETALLLLEEADTVPTAETVRDLVRPIEVQQGAAVAVNLQPYDQLLPSQRCAYASSTGGIVSHAARITVAYHGGFMCSDCPQSEQRESHPRRVSLRTRTSRMRGTDPAAH